MIPKAEALELLARGGAIAAFVGLGIAMVRPPTTPARFTGALFFTAAAAHTLTQHPVTRDALGAALPMVWVFSVAGAGLFGAFVVELFGDRQRLSPTRFAPAALLLTIGLAGLLLPRPAAEAAWLAHKLVGLSLMAHVLATVWAGWRNDLVEPRRNLRGPLLAAGALYAVAVLTVEAAGIFWRPVDALAPLAAVSLLALGLAGVAALLRADADLFAPPAKPQGAAVELSPPPAGGLASPALSGEEARLADSLDRLMRHERLYRDETLTIAALGSKLDIPEYRLRRLINQRLGYRNFNAYLGKWRLGEAMAALADPKQGEVPIATIALDAGFNSLGPFNRAFKAETGLTPTEYRAHALASARPNRAKSSS